MENVIVVLILALILGLAIRRIRREKKRGARCVGCPCSGTCSAGKCRGGAECGGSEQTE